MSDLHFNYIETCALGIVAYYAGKFIERNVKLIRDYFIPVPVVGGTAFAVLCFLFHLTGIKITFDPRMEEFFMSMFFVSIGFFIRTNTVRTDVKNLVKMSVLVVASLAVQNLIAIFNARCYGLSDLWGLCTGSMAMVGGFGSVSVFGTMIERLGHANSLLGGMGMSVLGLIGGGILGCPLAIRLIEKYNIPCPEQTNKEINTEVHVVPDCRELDHLSDGVDRLMYALLLLVAAMGVGSLVSKWFFQHHIFIPIYAGGIFLGIFLGNIIKVPEKEIRVFSNLSLNIFLSISLMMMDLSLLSKVLLPLFTCMIGQMIFMAAFCYFIVFRVLGKDYLSAVFISGFCGFGLGSLPTGMANINSLTQKYGDISIIYLLMPLVSSIADGFNGSLIILLINTLK